jgi:hypothetical protein
MMNPVRCVPALLHLRRWILKAASSLRTTVRTIQYPEAGCAATRPIDRPVPQQYVKYLWERLHISKIQNCGPRLTRFLGRFVAEEGAAYRRVMGCPPGESVEGI